MSDGLAVDQFVPALLPHDAVGAHTLESRRAFREAGLSTTIWARTIHHQYAGEARPYRQFGRLAARSSQRRLLLYQSAAISHGIVDYLLKRPEPKSISYHNLTPPEFYDRFSPSVAAELREAAFELARLAPLVRVATADSEFNATDLKKLGVPDVRVIPPYIAAGDRLPVDQAEVTRLRAGKRGPALLFVGRLVPNKNHQQLIRLVATLRAGWNAHAKLYLVGPAGPTTNAADLQRLATRLAPAGVIFMGSVGAAQLRALYEVADVFVSMSEHEGFGVPLVEAMLARLPVVALERGAVGETLGGSGVLLRSSELTFAAAMVARVIEDEALRNRLIEGQVQRARELQSVPRDDLLVAAARAAAVGA
ncbi:MAG: glycosyltransferase [Candidatus Dormibacteraeota bacterium]|uniref:Glycosyltransferase n=1 Tax=Candidatus Dormiibacter inghamiae TaxID=3127013 RepID=A0A934KF28_9BACT|nr:glycosyltransferase [Candidatus Dormibacteraeota bacterium]